MDELGGALFGIGIIIVLIILIVKIALSILVFAIGVLIMAIIPVAVGWTGYQTYLAFIKNDFTIGKSLVSVVLAVVTGMAISSASFLNSSPEIIFILLASGGSLVGSLAYPYIKRKQLIKKYRDGEKYLIEP